MLHIYIFKKSWPSITEKGSDRIYTSLGSTKVHPGYSTIKSRTPSYFTCTPTLNLSLIPNIFCLTESRNKTKMSLFGKSIHWDFCWPISAICHLNPSLSTRGLSTWGIGTFPLGQQKSQWILSPNINTLRRILTFLVLFGLVAWLSEAENIKDRVKIERLGGRESMHWVLLV